MLPTCEQQYTLFQETMSDIINTIVPVKQKTILSNDKPWITPEYKTLIARRQVAHVSGNRTLYNQLRNQINRLSESLRSEFYQKSVDKMCDSKNWWKTVKSLIGLKSKDPTVENFANNEYDGDTQKLISL